MDPKINRHQVGHQNSYYTERQEQRNPVDKYAKRKFEEVRGDREGKETKKSSIQSSIQRVKQSDEQRCKYLKNEIVKLYDELPRERGRDFHSKKISEISEDIVANFKELKELKQFEIPSEVFAAYFEAMHIFYIQEDANKYDFKWVFDKINEIHKQVPLTREYEKAHFSYIYAIISEVENYNEKLEKYFEKIDEMKFEYSKDKFRLSKMIAFYSKVFISNKINNDQRNSLWNNRVVGLFNLLLKTETKENVSKDKNNIQISLINFIRCFENSKNIVKTIEVMRVTKFAKVDLKYDYFLKYFKSFSQSSIEERLELYCEVLANKKIVNLTRDQVEIQFMNSNEGKTLVEAFTRMSYKDILSICEKLNKQIENFPLRQSSLFTFVFDKCSEKIKNSISELQNKLDMANKLAQEIEVSKSGIFEYEKIVSELKKECGIIEKRIEEISKNIEASNIDLLAQEEREVDAELHYKKIVSWKDKLIHDNKLTQGSEIDTHDLKIHDAFQALLNTRCDLNNMHSQASKWKVEFEFLKKQKLFSEWHINNTESFSNILKDNKNNLFNIKNDLDNLNQYELKFNQLIK